MFQYKHLLLPIFRGIIGLYDIAHMSIACINASHEVIFFSYTPAVEYQLIQSSLWHYDLSLHHSFYIHSQEKCWQALYHQHKYHELQYIKEQRHQFSHGIALSRPKTSMYCVYSFAFHSSIHHVVQDITVLSQLGDYCLSQCIKSIIDTL